MVYEYTENGATYYLIMLDGEIKQKGFESKEEAQKERDRYFSDPAYFDL